MVGLMTILGRRSALLESTRSHTSRRLREDVALRQADDLGEGVNAGAKRIGFVLAGAGGTRRASATSRGEA
jgi:hypothetical protein